MSWAFWKPSPQRRREDYKYDLTICTLSLIYSFPRVMTQTPSSLRPLHLSFSFLIPLLQENFPELFKLEHVVQTHSFSRPALDINSGDPLIN